MKQRFLVIVLILNSNFFCLSLSYYHCYTHATSIHSRKLCFLSNLSSNTAMASNPFSTLGLTFVPNNHSALLSIDGVNSDYHLFQRFLANSEILKALTEPGKLSGSQIKAFWESGVYSGDQSPEITFTYDNNQYLSLIHI